MTPEEPAGATAICPGCKTAIQGIVFACPKCGADLVETQRALTHTDDAVPAQAPRGTRPAVFLAGAIGIAVSGLWLFVPSKGLSMPGGAFVHERCKFALSPIAGWEQAMGGTRPTDCMTADSFFGPPVGYTPKPVMAFSMAPPQQQGAFKPHFYVFVVPIELPALKPGVLEREEREFWGDVGQNPLVLSAKADATQIVRLDNLEALKLSGTVRLTRADFDVKLVLTAIPGRGRTYAVAFVCDAAAFSELQNFHDFALRTFRVTTRPLRYSGTVKALIDSALKAGFMDAIESPFKTAVAKGLGRALF